MRIESIHFDGRVFKFKKGVNYIFGPSGSGKTRLLGAISKAKPNVAIIMPDGVRIGKWKRGRNAYTDETLSQGEIDLRIVECGTADAISKDASIICYDDMLDRLDPTNTKRVANLLRKVAKKRQIFLFCRRMPEALKRGFIILTG